MLSSMPPIWEQPPQACRPLASPARYPGGAPSRLSAAPEPYPLARRPLPGRGRVRPAHSGVRSEPVSSGRERRGKGDSKQMELYHFLIDLIEI